MKSLPVLYQEMADLTRPLCGACRAPFSCCSPEYCEMALRIAKDQGVDLARTDHKTLPLMGPTGCTAAPHFRPLCTLHVCSVNGLGFIKDREVNRRYFKLRTEIEMAHYRESREAGKTT